MTRVVIESSALRLEIVPALGAGIAGLWWNQGDGPPLALMRPAPADATWFNSLACYLLAPWSNRVPRGQFTFEGVEHALTPDWPDGSAIHGLVKDHPWRLIERTPVTALLTFDSRDHAGLDWPWPFRTDVRYELFDDALSVRLTLHNAAATPMPAGLGFHPFFPRALGPVPDEVRIRYAARGRYPAEGMIPTAPARPDEVTEHLARGESLRPLELDDVFLGNPDGAEILYPIAGVRLSYTCSPELTHAVIYSQQPEFFCFEPVTMVNDGFNLLARGWADTGVRVLPPGATLTADWRLRVGTL